MAEVEIVDKAREYVTRAADPDERWDADDTECDHDIRGVRLVKGKGYHDLTVGFDLEYDKTYFLLYAIYDTGNSFGREGGKIEFVGLYEDEKVADENLHRLREHNEDEQMLNGYNWGRKISAAQKKKLAKTHETYIVNLVSEDGQEYQVHVPWHGYFESLQDIEVEAVTRVR